MQTTFLSRFRQWYYLALLLATVIWWQKISPIQTPAAPQLIRSSAALALSWGAPPPLAAGNSSYPALSATNGSPIYQSEKRGATVPFVTLEAEDPANRVAGQVIAMSGLPSPAMWTPALEASGRAYVQLTNTGDYLEFPNVPAANTIVIRHCIPDAPTGGGILGTLSLYVNGVKRQSLTLSSKYNWLYQTSGTNASQNGQSNVPGAGPAHVFWDETGFFITNGLQAGDTLRLQKDDGDTAAYYLIDLIDLENVAPPLSPPPAGTYLSAADFGATGSDPGDDTVALQSCINAAEAQGKSVWLPPGTYYQSGPLAVNGVTVAGAGMWYTRLVGTVPTKKNVQLLGNAPAISNLCIANDATTSRISPTAYAISLGSSSCSNWIAQNVWITHTVTGFWITGGNGGTVRGCRVRMTYADAITLNAGSSNYRIEQNHVRGVGDDGMAILANVKSPLSTNDTLCYNTVIANWWGHNCDLAGGCGHVIRDNYLADNALFGCFTINLPASYPMNPVTSASIRRNTIVRGGGNYVGQQRGAIWAYAGSTTVTNVLFEDNAIIDPIFSGIQVAGCSNQAMTFNHNVVSGPGTYGVFVSAEAKGSGIFTSNLVLNAGQSHPQFDNAAGAHFSVTATGNSW